MSAAKRTPEVATSGGFLTRVRRSTRPRSPIVEGLIAVTILGCRADPRSLDRYGPPISNVDVYLEATADYRAQERERESDTVEDDDWEQTIYRESVGVSADGYVYHPNLIDFTASAAVGLVQSKFRSNRAGDRDRSDNGTLEQYDVNARFLRETQSPFTVFARRRESLQPRPFLSAEIQTVEEHGFYWQYLSEKTPTSLRYTKSDLVFDPLASGTVGTTRIDERTRTKSTEQIQLRTQYNFSDHSDLTLDVERRSVREDPFDINYDIDDVRLSHHVRFGDEQQHDLLSEVSRYDQRGSVDLERSQLRERLNLKHSDTLRSWYHLDVADRSQRGFTGNQVDDRIFSVGGNVEHKLYDSLTSQVGGWIDGQRFDGGSNIDRQAVRADLDYRKTNPYGVLTANYGVQQLTTERSGGDQVIDVIDLRRTFVDPNPIVLNEPQIIEDTIVVTDTTGLVFFKRDIDYQVVEFASRVELHRIPTGAILDGQEVLIDYEIDVANDNTVDSLSQRFGIRQTFDFGLSPYYRYEWQDQSIQGDNTNGILIEDISAHTLGVEYRRGGFHGQVEYQDHDSTIAPYESVTVGSDYSHRFDNGATAGLNARWTDVTFSGDRPRDATTTTAGVRYFHPLARSLSFEGSAQYLDDQDSISGHNEGVSFDLSLNWMIRRTKASIHFSKGWFQNLFATSNSTALFFRWELRF